MTRNAKTGLILAALAFFVAFILKTVLFGT